MEKRQEFLREGVFRGKHYFSSKNIYTEFPAEKLVELDKNRLQKLKEYDNFSDDEKIKFQESYYKEEIPYVFKREIKTENDREEK
jgi:hypothetical protein